MLIKSRLGKSLVDNGVIDKDMLNRALIIQADEDPTNPRRLEDILVTDLKVRHDAVYGLLADLYAFRKVDINIDKIDQTQINHTKEYTCEISR